ncbi:MAG: TatD family hydrolase [Candidatus Doudnabacteria bacterium]|nr:TatD family hydrolase [Candidatus Doudnabacteria bacterium]
MLIDTHAHVNFRGFKDDAKETLQRALDSGTWVINVGSQIDTSRQAVELANQFSSGIYAVVGLHPEHTHSQFVDEEETHFKTREEHFDYEAYRMLALDKKVVGIGECGLDYYRMPEDADVNEIKEKQKEAFRLQVKLAKELNKVLVIHSRPAKDSNELFDDLLTILDEELAPTTPPRFASHPSLPGGEAPQLSQNNRGASPPDKGESRRQGGEGVGSGLRFEVHSFTGSPEYLQKFLDRGGYVSFNGIITFDKTGNMEKLVKLAPLDKIILETDCPYLTPVPNRGKRNEPSFVKFTAEKVAQTRNLSADEIARITTGNAKKLFLI